MHLKNSHIYWCLAVLRVALVFAPQTGYIHPDEFFQSLEVFTGMHCGGWFALLYRMFCRQDIRGVGSLAVGVQSNLPDSQRRAGVQHRRGGLEAAEGGRLFSEGGPEQQRGHAVCSDRRSEVVDVLLFVRGRLLFVQNLCQQ